MIDLQSVVKAELDKVKAISGQLPWSHKDVYGMWLTQTYHMVSHSTRLVALAGAYTGFDREELHARFVDHAKEERGHPLLCLRDLKAIGFERESFPCLHPTSAIYQIQYYWIEHRHPIALFGYILFLEYLSIEVGAEFYPRLVKFHGENAATFVKLHAQEDVDHVEKALKSLSALPFEEKRLIEENLKLSANLYRAILIEIQAAAAATASKNAA